MPGNYWKKSFWRYTSFSLRQFALWRLRFTTWPQHTSPALLWVIRALKMERQWRNVFCITATTWWRQDWTITTQLTQANRLVTPAWAILSLVSTSPSGQYQRTARRLIQNPWHSRDKTLFNQWFKSNLDSNVHFLQNVNTKYLKATTGHCMRLFLY